MQEVTSATPKLARSYRPTDPTVLREREGPGRPSLPRLREMAARNDDALTASHDDRSDPNAYRSPRSPADDHPLALALKIGLAMLLADAIARGLGFESPTWSVLTAAFLATSPPIESARAAVKKVIAMAVGLTLGVLGAFAAKAMSGVPSIHFALVGAVTGLLGSRSPDYLFAAVVGTVVTFVGSGGSDPTIEVVTKTTCMILIGCLVGPAIVFAVERARRWWHARRPA